MFDILNRIFFHSLKLKMFFFVRHFFKKLLYNYVCFKDLTYKGHLLVDSKYVCPTLHQLNNNS